MNSDSRLSNPLMWDWTKGSLPGPFDWFQKVEQPILPGWIIGNVTINEQNSSAPATEQAIVAAQSYGRQLGRIMDAVALLIADLPGTERHALAFEEFARIRAEIDDIKAKAASQRLDRIADDLATLKTKKPEEYKRLAATMRAALKGG